MKKYLAIVAITTSFSFLYAADLSRYQNVVPIEEIKVNQPAIVQVTNPDQSGSYIITTNSGEVIPQQFETLRKVKIIPPVHVEACTSTCVPAPSIADSDERTTFDFPLLSSGGQKGKIIIVYKNSKETNAVVFRTTGDSYMPTSFTLTVDGNRILNTISGGVAKFPKMSAKKVEIEFDYYQPIRFTEVGIGSDKEEEVTNLIRFVYQPGTKYLLYKNSYWGRDGAPSPTINLYAKNKEYEAVMLPSYKNSLYKVEEIKPIDTDKDTVVDSLDNCPLQANTDQADGNKNGLGDLCDDYDYDGVATYMDNCPFVENQNQSDVDRDGLGDVCDGEESRFTEKHASIPWIVFGFVFLAVMGMGYEVVRKMKNKTS